MSHRLPPRNLRTVLLEQAEVVLRERGIDALSLRELAREAGVSHGAPRSHFIDRAPSSTHWPSEASSDSPTRSARPLRACPKTMHGSFTRRPPRTWRSPSGIPHCSTHVRDEGRRTLGGRPRGGGAPVRHHGRHHERGCGSGRVRRGRRRPADPAAVRDRSGIAALVTSRRITASQGEALVDDAIRLFLKGASAG